MKVCGVVWWRWPLFLAYLGLVAVVLIVGVRVVIAYPQPAFALFVVWVGLALAWPHRWYLAGLLRRA